jgi:hypothetical protein
MATPAIAFNPLATTTFLGGFSVSSDGLVQGVAMDDPAVRFALSGGILDVSETIPMYGGVGIYANVPTIGVPLGPKVGRATTVAANAAKGLVGFSVFNQAHAWMQTPQSPVPTGAGGMTVPYFLLGSGARIAVKADPGLLALGGSTIQPQVSWDFNAQMLSEYIAASGTIAVTSMTWSQNNGGQVAVVTGAATPYVLGDTITVQGATNTGTGNVAALNGQHTINTWTDASHFTFLLPGNSTIWGTIGGTITLATSGGALPCKLLRVQQGNCKTVTWDSINNQAIWDPNGTCALIQI